MMVLILINDKGLIDEINQIDSYLNQLKHNKISILKLDFYSYLNKEQLRLIESQNNYFGRKMNIGNVYQLIPPENIEIQQIKGFTLHIIDKNAKKNIDNNIKHDNESSIFLRNDLANITETEKFFLYHEMGHLTKTSSDIQNKEKYLTILILPFLFFLIFSHEFSYWYYSFCFIPLFFILFLGYQPRKERENLEEYYCDAFAIEMLKREEKYNFNRLISALNVLFPEKRFTKIKEYLNQNTSVSEVEFYSMFNTLSGTYMKSHEGLMLLMLFSVIVTFPAIINFKSYSFSVVSFFSLILIFYNLGVRGIATKNIQLVRSIRKELENSNKLNGSSSI